MQIAPFLNILPNHGENKIFLRTLFLPVWSIFVLKFK